MLSLELCLKAGRPLIFVLVEHDLELLKHLQAYGGKNSFFVYSTTLASTVPLNSLISGAFSVATQRAMSTLEVLTTLLMQKFDRSHNNYETYIFLDAETILKDPQNIRKIKDIASRYQLDENFTLSMIFVSQSICVPPALERLSEVVCFDLPNEKQLASQSDLMSDRLELKGEYIPSPEIVNNLKGLTLFEVEQAYLQSYTDTKDKEGHGRIDLNFIREFKKSSISKTDLLSLMEFGVGFDSIGGLDRLKQWVKKSYGGWTVEGKKYGLPVLKGVLMIGPPGVGKSLMMKAIGNEWSLPVINLDLSRVFSSRVGDSEANIRRVLKIVEGSAPCICVVDEMEKSFAGSQSSTFSDSGVTARIIAVFLSWMQDCEKPVFIAATCNNIVYLPPELISRFDEVFFVNVPQESERRDIFKIQLKRVNRDPSNFDTDLLAKKSVDFTGREIEQVIKESLYDAFYNKEEFNTDHILHVLDKKTNITTTFSESLRALYKWVGWSDQKKDGIRARFASVPDEMDVAKIQSEIDKLIGDVGK